MMILSSRLDGIQQLWGFKLQASEVWSWHLCSCRWKCYGRDSVEGVFDRPLVNRTVMLGRLGPNCLVRGRGAIRIPQEKGCPTLSTAAKWKWPFGSHDQITQHHDYPGISTHSLLPTWIQALLNAVHSASNIVMMDTVNDTNHKFTIIYPRHFWTNDFHLHILLISFSESGTGWWVLFLIWLCCTTPVTYSL